MIYTLPEQRVHGLQHLRDGLRCASLEDDLDHTVYTIDLGHEPHLAIEGRHIRHDFTDEGVLANMDSNWPGLIFHHIVLYYFYTPNFRHALHFSERMYTIILPLLASKGAIPIGGEVWLPHIPCIQERLERLWTPLAPWFSKHAIDTPSMNPLFIASANVEEQILDSGDRFTNGSSLLSLDRKFPFMMLKCPSTSRMWQSCFGAHEGETPSSSVQASISYY